MTVDLRARKKLNLVFVGGVAASHLLETAIGISGTFLERQVR